MFLAGRRRGDGSFLGSRWYRCSRRGRSNTSAGIWRAGRARAAGRMMTMQQCRVRGVRSVELAATNLEEAGRFYESVWGLRRVEARDGVQLYRGTAAYHHIVGLHRGPRPGLMRIVFDVADREGVDALHRAIAAAGGPATAPATLAADGGGYGFGCTDPDGRNL